MNLATTIMRDVRAAGGYMTAKNGKLKLSAPRPLPPALLDRVREAKPLLLATLVPHTWDATDWQAYYNERVAIAEYDGGLPRPNAEAQAFECCITRWLHDNGNSHLWLHGKYHDGSLRRIRHQAVRALVCMGINCN